MTAGLGTPPPDPLERVTGPTRPAPPRNGARAPAPALAGARLHRRLTAVQLAAQRLQHIARQDRILQVDQGRDAFATHWSTSRSCAGIPPVLARARRTPSAAGHGAATARSADPEDPTASPA
ncbi:hypothetical protein ACRAWF_25670 [Streptomyces sp. L7]